MENKFDIIAFNLSKDVNMTVRDKTIFNDYYQGKITLKQCYEVFCQHNGLYRKGVGRLISLELFDQWLKTLGY